MKQLKLLVLVTALGALAIGAGIAYAALGDTQSASGSVNVSSTSADLYICEPGAVAGPACGPDDSTGDESVFETLEDLRPGQTTVWNIRLKNVGITPFTVTGADLQASETSDPGNNCPPEAILGVGPNNNSYSSHAGVSVVGKAGDPHNDNESAPDDNNIPSFLTETSYSNTRIYIAPGDYEDVRLRLLLRVTGTENCDGNTWDVAWTFDVN